MGKFIDMTGWIMSEHGVPESKLTVTNRAEDHIQPNGRHEIMWNCKCQCGNDYTGRGADIRNGYVLSCGCLQKQKASEANSVDMTGWIMKEHGVPRSRLTVVNKVEDEHYEFGCVKWNCKCECGNNHIASGVAIRFGQVLSCGCLVDEIRIQNGLKQKETNIYEFNDDVVTGITNKGEKFKFSLCDYEVLKDYCWHVDANGYIISSKPNNGRAVKMHRLIMGEVDNTIVDHIDRDKTNNTRENLRIVTEQENTYNHSIAKNNISGIIGVIWHKRDCIWEAYISIQKQRIYLGRFNIKDDAIKARLIAEMKCFGIDFAPQRHLFKKYNITTNKEMKDD